jgi:hypothetical protein
VDCATAGINGKMMEVAALVGMRIARSPSTR